jgi:hypothetical protein
MKAKIILPIKGKLPERPKTRELPDPPLHFADLPDISPTIRQDEIVAFDNARHSYEIAKADYEAKGAALRLKVLQLCPVQRGDACIHIDERSGQLIVMEDRRSPNPDYR